MANSDQLSGRQVHVGVLPSAGTGHLLPCLRSAALLLRHNCKLTLITPQPTVSLAESQLISQFLSAFPQVTQLKFQLLTLDPATVNSNDPFFIQFETIRRSLHLLAPRLAALNPPLSTLLHDVSLISPALELTAALNLTNYVVHISSARMLSVLAYFHAAEMSELDDSLRIPGVGSIPRTHLPAPLLVKNSVFEQLFIQDGRKIKGLSGILVNTLEAVEGDTLAALNGGMVLDGFPPVIPVGPLQPCEFENGGEETPIKWLDGLPSRSVVFVSFGNRTAASRDQIKEIGSGLISSGYRFLWVVKDKVVDKEDKDGLMEVVGEELMKKMKEKGMVLKEWVNQAEILGHRAVGGFLSHCGWNSVMEAALKGVPVLGWPQIGDQMTNAELVAGKGLGVWVENWGWGHKCFVKGEEIGARIKEMMESEVLRAKALKFKEEAIKAVEVGGSCDRAIQGLIQEWNRGT